MPINVIAVAEEENTRAIFSVLIIDESKVKFGAGNTRRAMIALWHFILQLL